jgi:3-oxoacyl-ACP reductase-like protein
MFHATGLTGWQRSADAQSVSTPVPAQPPTPASSEATAAEATVEQELDSLQIQAAQAAATLDQIRRRIDEIAAAKSQDSEE